MNVGQDMNPNRKALVVVDVQEGLDDAQYGPRNNPDAELCIVELLNAWRSEGLPVIFSRYCSLRLDSPLRKGKPGNRIKARIAPLTGELVVEKSGNSVFKADGLVPYLKKYGISELVFAGIATDACVSTSAREAKDLGYAVWIVADACATFDRYTASGSRLAASLVHEVELGILHSAGIRVWSTSEMLQRLSADRPNPPLDPTKACGTRG